MSGLRTHREKRTYTPIVQLRVDVVSGPDRGRSAEADPEAPFTIGTSEGNVLVLSDPKVSRFHLELVRKDRGVHLEDLGSSNGTWLQGVDIRRAVVFPSTQLTIGDTQIVIRDGASRPPSEVGPPLEIPGIVAVSPRSRAAVQQIAHLAPSNVTVLLHGETGTGKEVAARALHDLSPRRRGPFVTVDCGSMPATLIASELFGHERGAFTGADRKRIGAFERAHGGTIFLDEIGELPSSVQPALLGPLERRRFRRVGGDAEIEVDVRVVAATHRDLRSSVNDGSFRADLYYRLAVAKIILPALRERSEDIPELVKHFVRETTGREDAEVFDATTLASLVAHPWSGNLRELRNVVEAALAVGEVRFEDSPLPPTSSYPPPSKSNPPAGVPLPTYRDARALALEQFERTYFSALIARCGSNASEAARTAHMDRNHLVMLLRKHALRD